MALCLFEAETTWWSFSVNLCYTLHFESCRVVLFRKFKNILTRGQAIALEKRRDISNHVFKIILKRKCTGAASLNFLLNSYLLEGDHLQDMVYTPNAATTDFAKAPSWTGLAPHVGVIGGSGLYKLEGLEVVAEINPITVSCSKSTSVR